MSTAAPGPVSGHAVTAGMALTDPRGRVLLVRRPGHHHSWHLPAGVTAASESPGQAAHRLVAEQLGLRIEPATMLAMHWIHSDPRRRSVLACTFLGTTLTAGDLAAITPRRELVTAWRMEDLSRARALLPEHIADRIPSPARPKVPATIYLETHPRGRGSGSGDHAPRRRGRTPHDPVDATPRERQFTGTSSAPVSPAAAAVQLTSATSAAAEDRRPRPPRSARTAKGKASR